MALRGLSQFGESLPGLQTSKVPPPASWPGLPANLQTARSPAPSGWPGLLAARQGRLDNVRAGTQSAPVQPVNEPATAGPITYTFGRGLQNALAILQRYTRRKAAADFLQELLQINSVDPAFQRLFGDQTQFGMGDLNTMLRTQGLITNPLRQQFLNTLQGIHNPSKYLPDIGITPYAMSHLPANILAKLGFETPEPTPPPPAEQPPPPSEPPPGETGDEEDPFAALVSRASGPYVETGARANALRQKRQEMLQQLLALQDPRILEALGAAGYYF